jgi:endonuclease YncB( thermonuclease family)
MSRSIFVALAASLFAIAPAGLRADASLANYEAVEITRVRQGDAFRGRIVSSGQKVELRLLGVDCADIHDRPAATYARRNLVGQIVKVSSENPPIPPAMDQLDRWIVYLELEDGADYGAELLESGHCTARTWSMRHPRQTEYASLERD